MSSDDGSQTRTANPTGWAPQLARGPRAVLALTLATLIWAGAAAGAGATGLFTKLPGEMTSPRYFPVLATLPSGKVLIAGGATETAPLRSAELFDPASGRFEGITAQMTVERREAASLVLPGGKVLIAGGENESESWHSAELFDPASTTFESIAAPMSTARVAPHRTASRRQGPDRRRIRRNKQNLSAQRRNLRSHEPYLHGDPGRNGDRSLRTGLGVGR